MIKKVLTKLGLLRKSEQEGLRGPDSLITELFRSSRMFHQYLRGFFTFRHLPNCVTVFGSSRFKDGHEFYQLAREVGQALAKSGFTVMTGGGPGIMEATNRGAQEEKGHSIGSKIDIVGEMEPNPYLDKWINFKYFFERKMMMTKYSVAFVVLPGGLGTLDELFEILTLIQTRKIDHFPVVLMGIKFWQPLLDFLKNTMLKEGTISQTDIDHLFVTDSPEAAVEHIKNHRV